MIQQVLEQSAVCNRVQVEERFRELNRFLAIDMAANVWMRRELLRKSPPPPTLKLRYSCVEELVLFNSNPVMTYITDCRFPPMRPGNCFANAMALTLEDPTLRYTEGWACMEQSMPTHHAWVTHPDGSVSDPTWLPIVEKHLGNDGEGMLPDYRARCVYRGVTIPLDNHLYWFARHETPNILAFGEMMPEEVLTMGMAAFDDAILPEEREPAIKFVRETFGSTPVWELAEDGSCCQREKADGSIDRWFG